MKRKVFQEIASLLRAIENCQKSGNQEWENRHTENLESIIDTYLPSGSGFDCGTKLVREKSNPEKLVFSCDYHHMNEAGMYDGWTKHEVVVTPSLVFGFNLRITGRDRRRIKEYMEDVFHHALATQLD